MNSSSILKVDFSNNDDPRAIEKRAVTKMVREHVITIKEGAEKLAKLGCSIDHAWHLAKSASLPS